MIDKTQQPAAIPLVRRLTVRGWFTLAAAVPGVLIVAAIVAGFLAISHLDSARHRVVGEVDPASLSTDQLLVAFLNQETGVRGYALSGQAAFLAPYYFGSAQERSAAAALREQASQLSDADLRADIQAVMQAGRAWRDGYVNPTLARVRAGAVTSPPSTTVGKAAFDHLRAVIGDLQGDLGSRRAAAERDLHTAATALTATFVAIAVLLLLAIALALIGLRVTVTGPVARLARQTRRVADGDFAQPLTPDGARDLAQLGMDVGSMRGRIVSELDAANDARRSLDSQRIELERSNAELEQFAYVASHDLQEPLRKVASFTQLLQQRYGDRLDARADEYIAFAADGAKRMQTLINDLLAYSRVGRLSADQVTTLSADDALDDALADLATTIEDSGAVIDRSPLPVVRGERSLIAAVFQNLIGNAIKFRAEDRTPHITVSARRDGPMWEFTCADNGIGIPVEYGERIFLIFQRLQPKERYPGTGIGLALSRKIVEYHGGRIWMDGASVGSTFRFTMPVPEEQTM
jgi:signal transduction histidine kinase